MNKDLKNMTYAQLEKLVTDFGEKKYLARYIFTFIQAKDTEDISLISPLNKHFREKLIDAGYYISKIKISQKHLDPDGTIKYLFELPDNNAVESVLIIDKDRRTLCVSTQVGCAANCSFCATAKLGFKRNLSAAEILAQLSAVETDTNARITNVVYMGMGEPMNNYDNVLRSIGILNDSRGKNIGIRHITISTCGVTPGIKKLADEDIFPRLAVSLNAATDKTRTSLMKINQKYPLDVLLDAIKYYQQKTGNRVTFEYVLIANINDTTSDAHALCKLLKKIKCNVNLIGLNPYPGCDFKPSTNNNIKKFKQILSDHNIETTVRLKRGQNIKGACGQLGAKHNHTKIK